MDYLGELSDCQLCEHRCRVNRLKGERGICRVGLPEVASAQLHPAPPESYTVFMAGCNYKCLNCQNWAISQYPDNGVGVRGYLDPLDLARECVGALAGTGARLMGADRVFFSGGEATIHLPYIEKVMEGGRRLEPSLKLNFDTNGFMTEESLERILKVTTSMTFDIKAIRDETHRALTGAPVAPVLRNAALLAREAPEKLWEFRVLVIPGINEGEMGELCHFIASLGPELPLSFLAFRPNFILEGHPGAERRLLERCLKEASRAGLRKAEAHGLTGIPGRIAVKEESLKGCYDGEGALLAASSALSAGCTTHPRDCRLCEKSSRCPIKSSSPSRVT